MGRAVTGFSALQRAEIAETTFIRYFLRYHIRFSALQRAEIAEISRALGVGARRGGVSVLFNEPKLLKLRGHGRTSQWK